MVVYTFDDIKCKEIINIKSGRKIGYADDIEFDGCTAKLCRIIIYGRNRFFGLLGREDDIVISWGDIEIIGEDAILVSCECPPKNRKNAPFGFFRRK